MTTTAAHQATGDRTENQDIGSKDLKHSAVATPGRCATSLARKGPVSGADMNGGYGRAQIIPTERRFQSVLPRREFPKSSRGSGRRAAGAQCVCRGGSDFTKHCRARRASGRMPPRRCRGGLVAAVSMLPRMSSPSFVHAHCPGSNRSPSAPSDDRFSRGGRRKSTILGGCGICRGHRC